MVDYRIRWRVKTATNDGTWINDNGSNGLLLTITPVSITNITGTSTITVTTSTAHNFKVGQGVLLSGVTATGTDASKLKGLVQVETVPTTTTFTYIPAATLSFTYSSGGTVTPTKGYTQSISSISGNGTAATVTTLLAHGFKVGEQIRITGTSVTAYNQFVEVTSVPTNTTFTFSTTTQTAATGGNAVSLLVFTIRQANSQNTAISAGTTYEVQGAFEPLTGSPTYSSGDTATPLAVTGDGTLPTGTTGTTTVSGTTQTITDGTATIQCGRISYNGTSGTLGYGIMITFDKSYNSWTTVDCVVTYMGKTTTLTATRSGKPQFVYFPVPLKASCVVTINISGGGTGTFTVAPYYG